MNQQIQERELQFITEEGAYEKIRTGKWTFKQFDQWLDDIKDRYMAIGYTDGTFDDLED